jgi:hypothetical protein
MMVGGLVYCDPSHTKSKQATAKIKTGHRGSKQASARCVRREAAPWQPRPRITHRRGHRAAARGYLIVWFIEPTRDLG